MPLRFPRPVTALVATGTAVLAIGLSAVPAAADPIRDGEWWLSSLSVTNVWPASQGAGVTVAVLSDGALTSQPDLAGAVTTATAIPGAPVATGQYFGEQGTPIASLIAGRGHGPGGGAGVIGVAPKARILSVPVTLPAEDPQLGVPAVGAAIPAAIAAGIKYAVNHGATVIDLPIDPSQPDSSGVGGAPAAAGGSAAERQAVAYALAHKVVLVAPAGDNALSTGAPNYPAAYPGVIAVGAFDSAFDKAPWTSHRGYVTLTAAGAGVVAASASGGYETMNSTSAASAIVAGIVALIRSRYPGLSVAEIRKALITTTLYRHPGGLTDGSGYGAVDAAKAFSAAAALGTPASQRADQGAQPLVTQAPAAAGRGAQSLSARITRAGEVSAAVLVVLLLAVAGYALLGRRRKRGTPPATLAAQWTSGHTQTRYPHAPVTEADRMLEYFAAPTQASSRLEISQQPARGRVAGVRPGDENPFTVGPAGGELERFGPYGPASRAMTKRPVVSGTPPWEPAAPPEGDLPWADTPARQTVPGQVVASGYESPSAEVAAHSPAGAAASATAGPASRDSVTTAPAAWVTSTSPADNSGDGRKGRWYEPPVLDAPPGGDHQARRRGGTDPASRPFWPEPIAPDVGPDAGFGSIEASMEAPPAPSASAPGVPDWADPASSGASPAQHRSGLPIRQPRTIKSPPRSPSGSLWDAAPSSGSVWEKPERMPRAGQGGAADPGDGPLYSWDPAQ